MKTRLTTITGPFCYQEIAETSPRARSAKYGFHRTAKAAIRAAYKYACFLTFAIPTEGDNDADAHTHEVVAKSFRSSPTMGAMDSITPEEQEYLRDLAPVLVELCKADPVQCLERLESEHLDGDQKTALWSILDSKTRAAIKKAHQQEKVAA